MAVQRFRTDVERTRHAFGWILIVVALVLAAGLASLEVRTGGRVTATALVVFAAILAGLFALGYWFAFKVRELFAIDVEQRTYALTEDGKPAASGALDDLGPLQVQHRTRTVGVSGKQSTRVEFVVHGKAHKHVDLYVEKTAGQARRRMEALAKAWRLPCRSLGGAVRGPDELDVPLHDRLRDDGKARTPAKLASEWGITIEPLSLGYAIRSRYRSWSPLGTSAFILAVGGFILSRFARTGFITTALHEEDPLGRVLVGGFVVVCLVMLWLAIQGVRDTFFPGTVRVTDRGVSYRFSRM